MLQKKWPEATAVADHRCRICYRDLHAAAGSLVFELQRAGIKAGDKVGVLCSKGIEYVVAFDGVIRAGGIVIPISRMLKALEIADLAEKMALDAFCYSAPFQSVISGGKEETLLTVPVLKDAASVFPDGSQSADTAR
jgi:acyl-CoA synthetase (AMP-forming)/AMP-acid ligase II